MVIEKPPELPGRLTIEPATCHVILPYSDDMIEQSTLREVMAWGGDYMCQQIDPEQDYAYPEALAEWWSIGLDTVIVRQDAVVGEGIIRELLACPQPWCVRAREIPRLGPRWNLDITKFSAQLMAVHPQVINRMIEHHTDQGTTKEWAEWDTELAYLLRVLGTTMHIHYPPRPGQSATTEAAGSG